MSRSICAVIAGFVLTFVLAVGMDLLLSALFPGIFSTPKGMTQSAPLLAALLIVTAISTVAGSYLTARIAVRRPLAHALVLGGIALVISLPLTVKGWNAAPAWYHVWALVQILPACWLGGWLRERQQAVARTPAVL